MFASAYTGQRSTVPARAGTSYGCKLLVSPPASGGPVSFGSVAASRDDSYLHAEGKARREIDRQFEACGWVVPDKKAVKPGRRTPSGTRGSSGPRPWPSGSVTSSPTGSTAISDSGSRISPGRKGNPERSSSWPFRNVEASANLAHPERTMREHAATWMLSR